MSSHDLRTWLDSVEKRGELLSLDGVKCELEMAGLAEILTRESKHTRPAMLFGNIPGYPKGFRTLFGMLNSLWRVSLTLGLAENVTNRMSLLEVWRKKARDIKPISPQKVATGPILANSIIGSHVDVLKFPVPLFHELDGGRYIGTGVVIVQEDPDEGWINLGTYRVMVVDANNLAIHMLPARHGRIMMQKYVAQAKVMPVAVVAGIDHPLTYWAGGSTLRWGYSEYDYAGGIRGEPIKVVEGPYTGLPIPAYAEIVIEGEYHPGEHAEEGPFGEWHGYYANAGLLKVSEPVIRVKAIHYRDNPILTCAHVSIPPNDESLQHALNHSAAIWNYLEETGIPGIRGVWCHEFGIGNLFNVISLKQLYAGHVQMAGVLASQHPSVSVGRYTVVVDDDIDPFDLEAVLWAVTTRARVEESIQIINNCRTSSADPAIPLAAKLTNSSEPKSLTTSRVIINGCQPFEHKANWYPMARLSPELREQIASKWMTILSQFTG